MQYNLCSWHKSGDRHASRWIPAVPSIAEGGLWPLHSALRFVFCSVASGVKDISASQSAHICNFLTFGNKVSPGGDMFFLTGTQVPQVRGTCGHTGPQVRGSSEERPAQYYGNIT